MLKKFTIQRPVQHLQLLCLEVREIPHPSHKQKVTLGGKSVMYSELNRSILTSRNFSINDDKYNQFILGVRKNPYCVGVNDGFFYVLRV